MAPLDEELAQPALAACANGYGSKSNIRSLLGHQTPGQMPVTLAHIIIIIIIIVLGSIFSMRMREFLTLCNLRSTDTAQKGKPALGDTSRDAPLLRSIGKLTKDLEEALIRKGIKGAWLLLLLVFGANLLSFQSEDERGSDPRSLARRAIEIQFRRSLRQEEARVCEMWQVREEKPPGADIIVP